MLGDLPTDPGRQPLVTELVRAWGTFSREQQMLVAHAIDPALVVCIVNRLQIAFAFEAQRERKVEVR